MLKSWLRERHQKDPGLFLLSAVILLYSIGVYWFAWAWRFTERPQYAPANYSAYFDKWNWSLYPAFFVIVFLLVYYTWHPFLDAWQEVGGRHVVRKKSTGRLLSTSERGELIKYLRSKRITFVVLAFVSSLIYNVVDTTELRQAYTADSLASARHVADAEPDFFVKWCYDTPTDNAHNNVPVRQIVFTCLCYFQQFIIIALALLALWQILAQALLFGVFEKLRVSQENDFTIALDYKDPAHEFGLHQWNNALDEMYWVFDLALIPPSISRLAQGDLQHLDIGQKMGMILMAVAAVLPLFIHMFNRSVWKEDARRRAEKANMLESFRQQRLWPFVGVWQDHLGVYVCFSWVAVLVLGLAVLDIAKIVLPRL